jgi:hypothetical protein
MALEDHVGVVRSFQVHAFSAQRAHYDFQRFSTAMFALMSFIGAMFKAERLSATLAFEWQEV